jgi:1-deoxy-D-xylulose-5-phosphate reductoisomerase
MKKVLILGSTGSIGRNTLNVIRNLPDQFKVTVLTVNTRIDLLEPQIEEFNPEFVVVKEEKPAEELRKKLNGKIEVLSGIDGLCNVASECDYDIFIGAMVGSAGLAPTIQAIKRGKRIALANKETLVVAGELITELAKKYNADIIPVDSEHSAVFQCLIGENTNQVEKLILTASGGPFLFKTKNDFLNASVEEALNHPNWKMGNKISIDSASMMNKGLEVIEAKWLFNISQDQIDVVIHPQSIIHSMVQFKDGSIKAQLGLPDMKLPIQFALTYPDRIENNYIRTNLPLIGQLTFFEPDLEKFECLKIAYAALNSGGSAPCVLNAANEIAVDKFLKGVIKFSRIPYIINKSLERIEHFNQPDLDIIFQCDKMTREFAAGLS